MGRPLNPWDCPLPKPRYDLRLLSAKFESYAKAKAERNLRMDQLRRSTSYEAQLLANTLAACVAGDTRCLSPACPICCRRARLWFAEQLLKLWASHDQLQFWTLIPVNSAVPRGQLSQRSPARLGNMLWQQLARIEITAPIVGGIDGEFDQTRGVWQPHFHLIVLSYLEKEMLSLCRRFYPQAPYVYRPFKAVEVTNRPALFSYLCKLYWPERVGWVTKQGNRRSGHRRLEYGRHIEWLLWRDQFALTEFMFMSGVRRRGCRLEFTDERYAGSIKIT